MWVVMFLLRLIGGTQIVQKYMDSKGAKNFRIVYNEEIMQSAWKTNTKII